MTLGTLASGAMVQSASSLLFGVTPRDPVTFAGMSLMLIVVALTAGYLPARRASRIDPMVALRTE
jgi:putative ABC transport system permease protein